MRNQIKLKIFLPLVLLFAASVQAQEDKELEAIQKEITNSYSSKVEEALKKDQAKYDKMKSEAEGIEKIKDNEGKKKAINNYSNAHKAHYKNAVKSAGVDINNVLNNLKSKFTGHSFSSPDGLSIIVEKKETEAASESNIGVSSTVPEVGISSTTTTQALSFAQSKSINCAMASGGTVTFGTRSVKASTTGVVAGGCTASGRLQNSSILPSSGVVSIKLKLNFTLDVEGYAVGVLGTSATSASATVSAKIDGQSSNFLVKSLNKLVLAPVLWVASFNESQNFTNTIDLTASKGKTLLVSASGYSNSISGFCCATSGYGRSSLTTSSLEIVK